MLLQYGDNDVLQPASYADADASLFTGAERVTTAVVSGAGHALNGHFSAPVGWRQIDRWIRSTLGW